MSPPKTRRRSFPVWTGTGYRKSVAPSRVSWKPIIGTQVTVSEGHPFKSRKKGDVRDVGGPFETTNQYLAVTPDGVRRFGRYDLSPPIAYEGNIVAYPGASPWPPPFPPKLASSTSELEALGATAIARCKPTNSVADATTFLLELLKDGLPSIPGDIHKRTTLKGLNFGSEYLNVVFGWQPIANDIEKFLNAVSQANTVLKQYERDNGKVVRRSYKFDEKVERFEFKLADGPARYEPGHFQLSHTTLGGPRGSFTCVREVRRRQWFSGAFTFYIPIPREGASKMERYAMIADEVFGLSLSPENLWNVAPWSWAADWFANTGDVLSNISDAISDGLVLHYGYMMETTTVSDSYAFSHQSGQKVPVSPFTLVTETKKRVKATPYGFGLTWDGFSPSQLAILAALGISRR